MTKDKGVTTVNKRSNRLGPKTVGLGFGSATEVSFAYKGPGGPLNDTGQGLNPAACPHL